MSAKIIQTNWDNPNLYCIWSKEKIEIGEKYILVFEKYFDEWIEKTYKVEYRNFIDE